MIFEEWLNENKSKFKGIVKCNEPLAKHTYYKIGGPADFFFQPSGISDLVFIKEFICKFNLPFFILGAGSNLLVSDNGFRGIIIKTSDLNKNILEKKESLELVLGAGVMISSLLRMAMHKGWGGLEFLAGVPGTVGGGVAMNAGTHLGETKSALRSLTLFSFSNVESGSQDCKIVNVNESNFEYRKNLILKPTEIIFETVWKINFQDPHKVTSLIREALKRRKESQPVEYPSCGSVFKNPYSSGLRSWQVIDQLGLRGVREGQAQFSEKHSNFIINLGGATANDVRSLIDRAKNKAKENLGILLEEEVRYLGDF